MNKHLENNSGTKPFRLFKYFALVGFLVVGTSTIVLSLFLFHQEESFLLRKNEEFAHVVSDNLNHQIFRKFVLTTAKRYGKILLREEEQYNLLDTVVNTTLYGFKVDSVTLFNNNRHMVYSTLYSLDEMMELSSRPNYADPSTIKDPHLEKALEGQINSTVLSQGTFFELYFEDKPGLKKLRFLSPFRIDLSLETKTEPIMGVLEVVLDISEDIRDIWKQQTVSIATAVLIMLFMFLTLLLIVHRAEQTLDRRREEKERLEQQLNQAERLAGLGRMVAGVSHEIRNPLGIISSTAEILAQRMRTYEPSNRLSDIIIEESQRMNGILTEFLDFARPQDPKPKQFLLRDVVERILSHLGPLFERNDIEVHRDFRAHLRPITADPDLLYRGLLNVLNNAVQAMPEGGKLTVSLGAFQENGATRQHITINDTGDGVPGESLKEIFNPFFTTREKGTGLGLAIVKNIVESHGGRIDIKSPFLTRDNGEPYGTSVSIILSLDPQK